MKARLLLTLLLAACTCGPAHPIIVQQSPDATSPVATGSIAGVLRDPTGAVVPGAKVEVRSQSTGLVKSVTTSHAGRFAFDGLPAGRYDATIIVSGFQIVIIRDIAVVAGKETTVNVTLRFGR